MARSGVYRKLAYSGIVVAMFAGMNSSAFAAACVRLSNLTSVDISGFTANPAVLLDMPTNSNFWLRLAAVQSVIAEDPLSVAEMMKRSVALAPHDESMILTRFYFWNDFTNATLSTAKAALNSDLVTMLKLGDRCRVNATIKEISPQLRPIFDRTWAGLGDGATARFRQRCSK